MAIVVHGLHHLKEVSESHSCVFLSVRNHVGGYWEHLKAGAGGLGTCRALPFGPFSSEGGTTLKWHNEGLVLVLVITAEGDSKSSKSVCTKLYFGVSAVLDVMGFLLLLCVTCRRWARCFLRGTPCECFSLVAYSKEITITSCFTLLWHCFRCLKFRERYNSVYCIIVVIGTGQIQNCWLSFH